MGELSSRRAETAGRIVQLRSQLKAAEALASGKACAYATGSFGRGEASKHSDLDLFMLGRSTGKEGKDGKEPSQLNRLNEICIKADLIEVTRKLGIPEFSGDGQYLVHYSVHELTKTLGMPEDDATNTFTARLLLLLESCPLIEDTVYKDVCEEVIAAYWKDYQDHKLDFMPAYLANDILRLWRTFCVNYEARTSSVPDEQKAKRKLKNYKLKHSRLLTCYSALLYLLAIYGAQKTVHPQDATCMIALTPTQRLEWLLGESRLNSAHDTLKELMNQYERFLETTNAEEQALIRVFMDSEKSRLLMGAAYKFGDLMFDALNHIGKDNSFFRLLVV